MLQNKKHAKTMRHQKQEQPHHHTVCMRVPPTPHLLETLVGSPLPGLSQQRPHTGNPSGVSLSRRRPSPFFSRPTIIVNTGADTPGRPVAAGAAPLALILSRVGFCFVPFHHTVDQYRPDDLDQSVLTKRITKATWLANEFFQMRGDRAK